MIYICKTRIYTTRYVYLISFICTVTIYIFVSVIINICKYEYSKSSILKFGKNGIVKVQFENDTYKGEEEKKEKLEEKVEENVEEKLGKKVDNERNKEIRWYVEIPKIKLKAEISEGTTKEVLDFYVGHFNESSKLEGNICLAAHNRGYRVNYFKDLKQLKKGDEIKYYFNGKTKEYIVQENIIIRDEDWTYLEETKENVITLITCVENEPSYRRCVRAEEKGKEIS